jgi:predicted amidohydrolase
LRRATFGAIPRPEKGLEFWGGSFFCDPFGRVLAEASHDKEEILLGEVDLQHLEDTFAATGRSCAIGGLTVMRRSRTE